MNLVPTFYNLLFLLLNLQSSLSRNILAVTTLPSPSHHIWHMRYLKELVRKGHNVTLLTHEEETYKHINFTVITLEGIYDIFDKHDTMELFGKHGAMLSTLYYRQAEAILCDYDLKTNGLKVLLNYPPEYNFDLIIWDLNCGRCLYPLIDRFGIPPVIGTSPFGNPSDINYIFGGATSSMVPYYQVVSSNGLTFLTRLQSFICNYINIFTRYLTNLGEYKLSQNLFGENIRSVDEVERNFSIVLANIDPILTHSRPLPPNIIPVGGLHTQPIKELSQDLQRTLDESRNGVIVVVFGTNLNWLKFGQKQQQAFIEAFRKLKYTILLKSPNVSFELPSNVIVKNYIPLNDVLGHPNVKLIVTHGGSLTTYEALYHGIPIVGIPFSLDQFGNMGRIHTEKLGKSLTYEDLSPNLIYDTVLEVLSNPIFNTNIKKASYIFKNQLHSPLERAIFWTEYVLEFGCLDHLSIPARDFNVLQNHSLDILALVLTVLSLFLYLVNFALKKLINYNSSVAKQKLL